MGIEIKPTTMWPVNRPLDYENNHKDHTPETIAKIQALIAEFGFINPMIVDEDEIILAGHRRRAGARNLGLVEVPVVQVLGLSDAQKMAYRIADNRSAEDSDTNTKALIEELERLAAMDYDLLLTGHDPDEITKLLHKTVEGEGDENEAPDAPLKPVTQTGDVWELGSHRITCGDSVNALVVGTLMAGVRPGLMVTDPPVGAASPEWRDVWALFPGDIAYVWHAGLHAADVDASLRDSGFEIKAQIIWKKPTYAIGAADYHVQHEAAWYAVRKGAVSRGWGGDRTQSTIWEVSVAKKRKDDEKTGHAGQKPVELFARAIRNNTNPGQAVYEPFSGPGTAIIACEREGRVCYAVEISAALVDVAVTRWEKFTGKTAILMATGQTFAEVLAERTPEALTGQRGVKG